MENVTNIVIAGLGGQGVLKATNILASVIFAEGHYVKKSEIHGMSQRGGSVKSEVRYGREVMSPMVTHGEADFLLVLTMDQVEINRNYLRKNGILITPESVDEDRLPNKRSINIALLGVLSAWLDIPEERWLATLRSSFAENLHEANEAAFHLGRETGLAGRK